MRFAFHWSFRRKRVVNTMQKGGGEGGSDTQKRVPESSPDTVGAKKKTSTPSTSDRRWEDCIVSHICRSCTDGAYNLPCVEVIE